MSRCVILRTNGDRGQSWTFFARRTPVVGLRIPGLRSRRDLERRVSDFLAVDTFLDQLIAVRQCLPGHRERLGAVGAKEAVQLFVVSGDAEFVFGLDVVVFQIVVIDGPPVPSDSEVFFRRKSVGRNRGVFPRQAQVLPPTRRV